jgi:CheY-like chemotaxis protein
VEVRTWRNGKLAKKSLCKAGLRVRIPPMSLETEGHRQQRPTNAVILVVEDEPMVGEVVCAMLQLGGFESILVRTPVEALAVLADAKYRLDLLLTDYRMPEMTGLELIERCQSLRPRLKTVLYSGNADESVVVNGRPKPDRFLSKPFTPSVLNDLLGQLLAD